jgi:hypothetical protein
MRDSRQSHAVGYQSVFQPVLSSLARLVQQLRRGHSTNGELENLQALLESLPLSTQDFGLACNRLQNAQRYLHARERGAAKWELHALQQHLRTHLEVK